MARLREAARLPPGRRTWRPPILTRRRSRLPRIEARAMSEDLDRCDGLPLPQYLELPRLVSANLQKLRRFCIGRLYADRRYGGRKLEDDVDVLHISVIRLIEQNDALRERV